MTKALVFNLARPLRLGTRASPLALAQANSVAAALCSAHRWPAAAVELVTVVASGDQVQDRALAEIGGKALWTKELDRALQDGSIDLAVHSMKDVETRRPPALTIAAMMPRADVRDRLVGAESIAALPPKAVVGTASPRRRAQLLRLRPDLVITLLRGNVQSRLAKLAAGDVDATLLAAAGLDRLEMADTGHAVPLDVMLPAASQGAIGIEARADNAALLTHLAAINHAPTFAAVMTERQFLDALGADCHSCVAAFAQLRSDGQMHLRAQLLSADGQESSEGDWLLPAPDAADESARAAPDGAAALARAMLAAAPASIRADFGG
jgi:hydroxymethylbilane synthase